MLEFFLKFRSFYLANKEIQSGKIQNNKYFFNFPVLRLMLNFLVCKIKEWEFEKKFCRSLPYFYTYTLTNNQIVFCFFRFNDWNFASQYVVV